MKVTDETFIEKNILKYDKLYGEIAIISNQKGETALVNVRTGKTVMPFRFEKIQRIGKNIFGRVETEFPDDNNTEVFDNYATIYDGNTDTILADRWKYVYDGGSELSILENPNNGKKRLFNMNLIGTTNDPFQNEYDDIEHVADKVITNSGQVFIITNIGNKALYTTCPNAFLTGFNSYEIEYDNNLFIFRDHNREYFYLRGFSEDYDSVRCEKASNDIRLLICQKGHKIDVFHVHGTCYRKAFTIQAEDIELLNYSDEMGKQYGPNNKKKAQYLFAVTRKKGVTIYRAVLTGWGELIVKPGMVTSKIFDKVPEKKIDAKRYIAPIEKKGLQGVFRDDKIAEHIIVPPKYERVDVVFDKYALAYEGKGCDIIDIYSGETLVRNCIVSKEGNCILYRCWNSVGILDINGIVGGFDSIEQIKGNYYATKKGNKYGLTKGTKVIRKTQYASYETVHVTPDDKKVSDMDYFLFKRENGNIDVVRLWGNGYNICNHFIVNKVIIAKDLIVLIGPNKSEIQDEKGNVIKTLPADAEVTVNEMQKEANNPDKKYAICVNGTDYVYNTRNIYMDVVPMESMVVYARKYEGVFGTVLLTDTDKETFDEYAQKFDQVPDEDFEHILRLMFIEDAKIYNNPKYMELKRKL